MANKKHKQATNKNSKRKITKFILFASIIVFLVSSLFLFLSIIFKENLVMSEIFLLLAGAVFILPLSLIVAYRYKMVKVIDKIVIPLFVVGALFFSAKWVFSSAQLYLDKEAYDQRNFKVAKGIPSEITYDGSKNGPDYIDTITIDDTKIKVSHLFIVEKDFNKRLRNKPLKIKYLPISKYAISVEKYQWKKRSQ
ncbi:hypothetical protein V7139_19655 [Neobacillus drentensis]|uniref:hypothetical protein n=1 Tax=Neobacillus drentensis TaxID=220684 RepID=UPI003002F208